MKRTLRRLLPFAVLLLLSVASNAAPIMGQVVGKIACAPGQCNGVAALWQAKDNRVPAPDRYLLIPAVATALDADGSFELNAPPGEYFVGALLRSSPGPLFGAPRDGDQIYIVRPEDEQGYRVTVVESKPTDVGAHSTFWNYTGMDESPSMGVSGQVLDLEQKPVAGLLVFAFADPGATTTPVAVSQRTDKDGRFVLPIIDPGPVYLRARKNYRGGQPQPAEYVGVATGLQQTLIVEPGKMKREIKVLVRKLPNVLAGKNAPLGRPKVDPPLDRDQ